MDGERVADIEELALPVRTRLELHVLRHRPVQVLDDRAVHRRRPFEERVVPARLRAVRDHCARGDLPNMAA